MHRFKFNRCEINLPILTPQQRGLVYCDKNRFKILEIDDFVTLIFLKMDASAIQNLRLLGGRFRDGCAKF